MNGMGIKALEEALVTGGKPEIFNSDQGSQFTNLEFIKVSMSAKVHGGTMCLQDVSGVPSHYENLSQGLYPVSKPRTSLASYIAFYNQR